MSGFPALRSVGPGMGVLAAAGLWALMSAAAAQAAGDAFCRDYANTALQQFAAAREVGCEGLAYPVWSMDFNHHYRWCRTVSADQAQAGTAQRTGIHQACLGSRSAVEVTPIPIPGGETGLAVTPIPIPGGETALDPGLGD